MPNMLYEIDNLASPGGWYVMAELENIGGGTEVSFLRCINLSPAASRRFAFTLPLLAPFSVDVTPCHRANLHRSAFWPNQAMEVRLGSFGGGAWQIRLLLDGQDGIGVSVTDV